MASRGPRVKTKRGEEVGAGKESINRKCPWNMPYSRLRPGHPHPHSSLVSVLPEMFENLFASAGQNDTPLQQRALFLVVLGHLSLARKQRHSKSLKLYKHLSENSELEKTGRGIAKGKPLRWIRTDRQWLSPHSNPQHP